MHKTNFEALSGASSFLVDKGRDENAARLLLQHVLQTNYSGLMMRMQDELPANQFLQFKQMVERHAEGQPVQYIIGYEEFYGRKFHVDESVLIPRPETEELIVCASEHIRKLFSGKPIQLADIGTGSGAIAVTMKLEHPEASVLATDLMEPALETAKRNAKSLGADIEFALGNLTEPLQGRKWDVVLSNPPYIAFDEAADMSEVVLEYEPHTALFAEEEGLILYRQLAEQLPPLINVPGFIAVEIGCTQGQAVKSFFENSFPNAKVSILKDINGKDRIVSCQLDE